MTTEPAASWSPRPIPPYRAVAPARVLAECRREGLAARQPAGSTLRHLEDAEARAALAAAIATGRRPSDSGAPRAAVRAHGTTVLVGRADELAALERLVEQGRSVAVAGEPGIGRTAVLRAVAARPRSYFGGALETLAFVPYLPIVRAVGPLPGGAPDIVADVVVRAVGSNGLLVLDDLQCADEATLALLGRLVGRITLIASVRSTDAATRRVLTRLRASGFDILDLPPLGPADAVAVARMVQPRLDPAALAGIAARAGGNPMLIEELAATGASTSLVLRLRRRLAGLDVPSRRLLELLAIADEPLVLPDSRSLRGLRAQGLLEMADGAVAVRHGLMAEIARTDLPAARRSALHATVAGLSGDPVRAAGHSLAAGQVDRAAAIAAGAMPGATVGRRARLAAMLAAVSEGPDATAARIGAARDLAEAGWYAEADHVAQAVAPATPVLAAARLDVLSRTAWGLGDLPRALAAAEEGLERIRECGSSGPDGPDDPELLTIRADLLVDRAWLAAVGQAPERAPALAGEALAATVRAALPESRALRIVAQAAWSAGATPARVDALVEAAVSAARSVCDLVEELHGAFLAIAVRERAGELDEALGLARLHARRAREADLPPLAQALAAVAVRLLVARGDLAAAIVEGEALVGEAIEARTRAEAAGSLALALVSVGRLEDAAALIEAGLAAAPGDVGARRRLLLAAVEQALAGGQHRQAEVLAARLQEQHVGLGPDELEARVLQAWARLERGSPPRSSRAPITPQGGAFDELRGIDGLARAERGRRGAALQAAERFEAAAAGYRGTDRRRELRARWARGEALRRAGHVDAAVAVLREAEAEATARGMGPLLGSIHRSLRRAGVRCSSRSRDGGRLSSRERQVVTLVAAGLTNAQIGVRLGLGRPTVARLVSNAAAKLGTTSRAQTAVRAAEVA